MERHLSTSLATIVALMAAHRAAFGKEGAPVTYCQEKVNRIDAYLHDKEPTWDGAVWMPAAPDGRGLP
jgi:hypothetical protein